MTKRVGEGGGAENVEIKRPRSQAVRCRQVGRAGKAAVAGCVSVSSGATYKQFAEVLSLHAISQRYRCQLSHPRGGVRATPLLSVKTTGKGMTSIRARMLAPLKSGIAT